MRDEFVGVVLMLFAALGVACFWLLVSRWLVPGRSKAGAAQPGPPADAAVERVPPRFLAITLFVLVLQLALLLLAPWAISVRELSGGGMTSVAVFIGPLLVGWYHARRKGAFRW